MHDFSKVSYLVYQTTDLFKFKPLRNWTKIFQELPHFAKTDKTKSRWQWLSDGYYFWLNSNHWAHWWGNQWFKEYLITEYCLHIDRARLLDLITNPDHIKYFLTLLKDYQGIYDQAVQNGRESELIYPSVCAVLTYYRDKLGDGFPFQAILAEDEWKDFNVIDKKTGISSIPMAPDSNKHEAFGGLSRPQVCVFYEYKDVVLFNKTAHFPETYIKKCS